jgi:hypothetical protein
MKDPDMPVVTLLRFDAGATDPRVLPMRPLRRVGGLGVDVAFVPGDVCGLPGPAAVFRLGEHQRTG